MRLLSLLLLCGAALLGGCSLLEDNGTRFAYALERGAKKLRASSQRELVVKYETLDGANVPYYVELTPSIHPSGQRPDLWHSYLVVSGKTSGGTSYHNRFVFVPERLFIKKTMAARPRSCCAKTAPASTSSPCADFRRAREPTRYFASS